MKNKLRLLLILALSACLAFAGCGTRADDADREDREEQDDGGCDVSLYVHGLNVIALMEELADSEEYAKMMSVQEELLDMILEAGEGNYTGRDPEAVYEITLDKDFFDYISEEYEEFDELSGEVQDYACTMLTASFVNMVNARGGVNCVAASGISKATKVFVCDKLNENVIYLYIYENALPVAVSFTEGEDNAVMASGTFIFDKSFTVDSMEEVEAFLRESEMPVSVKEIKMK